MEIYIGFDQQHRVFRNPINELQAWRREEIPRVFAAVESALRSGCFVAGLLSYEAGYAFEDRFAGVGTSDFPLMRLGVFKNMEADAPAARGQGATHIQREMEVSFDTYRQNIETIREYIRRGDVYQITYCVRNRFRYEGDAAAMFWRLLKRQPVPYPALVLARDWQILSLSPELFFRKSGPDIVTKPMKGTWRRGANFLTDWIHRRKLHFDEKNRAENVMIADLMRNDLGRIGTRVRVPRLFEVASYTTLHQMTSTVTARVPADLPVSELFRVLFPSGSVTGAPKIRAMEIIREVEPAPRRIHTGAIGYMTPAREMMFNVAIRTLLLRGADGEMGVGGGIVWDSTPEGEYQECRIKSAFLDG